MFKTKRYTLKFDKTHHYINGEDYKCVKDSHLISVLSSLQSKYDFKIISIDFGRGFGYNITIKCNKKDYQKIFGDYCLELGEHITDISF